MQVRAKGIRTNDSSVPTACTAHPPLPAFAAAVPCLATHSLHLTAPQFMSEVAAKAAWLAKQDRVFVGGRR